MKITVVFMTEKIELNRMRWRSRRGMLELDLLLVPFFDEEYGDLSTLQQQTFKQLLAEEDADLIQWFSRKGISDDPALAAMVNKILARVQP